jgi:hypothetical protein
MSGHAKVRQSSGFKTRWLHIFKNSIRLVEKMIARELGYSLGTSNSVEGAA